MDMDSDKITNGICFRNDHFNYKYGKHSTSPLYILRFFTFLLFRRFRYPKRSNSNVFSFVSPILRFGMAEYKKK